MIRAVPTRSILRRLLGSIICALAAPANAAPDPSALCEAATERAATASGVPLSVLQAIALGESGRASGGRQRPWPWTVNFGGDGHYFAGRAEAESAVAERQAVGTTNFDIGCFQINHRWHGAAFSDVSAMFDPDRNALYAAGFLARLYAETGSWSDAAAAYHSRTPEYAERYLARFEALRDGLEGGTADSVAAGPRENRFPLLQAGSSGGLGSLVPQSRGGVSLIGAMP